MKFDEGNAFDNCIDRIKASIILDDSEKERMILAVEKNRGGFGNGK